MLTFSECDQKRFIFLQRAGNAIYLRCRSSLPEDLNLNQSKQFDKLLIGATFEMRLKNA
jgi:hypothetical protein